MTALSKERPGEAATPNGNGDHGALSVFKTQESSGRSLTARRGSFYSSATDKERLSTAWQLVLASFFFFFSEALGRQAEVEIWNRHYAGNFAQNAKTQALLQSISGVVSLVLNPVIAASTDAFGRKPVWIFAEVASALACLARVVSPSIGALVLNDLARPLMWSTWYIATAAAMGDLYKREPALYQKFTAYFQMMQPLKEIITPVIGSSLAQRDLRLPSLVGFLLYLASIPWTLSKVPETCGRAARVPFQVKGANPLTFARLFVNGGRLRLLAFFELLGSLVDGRATYQISVVQRQEVLGWGMEERARFQTFSAASYVPGYLLVQPLTRLFGAGGAMIIGTASMVGQNLMNVFTTEVWHLYGNTLLTSPFRALPQVGLKTPTMQAAVAIGMAQGELQGAISNLQTICRILAPLLWSNLYAWGSKRGTSWVYYYWIALGCFLQLLCAASVTRGGMSGN